MKEKNNMSYSCSGCSSQVETFNGENVQNAWQKKGCNWYDCKCPVCGKITTISIKIEND